MASIQGMKIFDKYQILITSGNLVIRNLDNGVMYGKASAVSSSTDKYSIVVNKLVNLAIILVNTNIGTTEDIKAYEFDPTGFTITAKTFTGLSNKNFKAAEFYEGKLLLGGNPSSPGVLWHSKTFSALSLANIYDFSAYNSGSQPIGDGERIVAFSSNNTEFFIIKANGFHKITGDKDTGSAYAYTTRQETSTGVLNPFCIVNVEKDIVYFDGVTIRRLSYEQNIQALADSAVGEPIEKIFANLSQEQKDNAFMTYAYPYVKLYLRSNISNQNDFAVLYNVVDKAFSIQTNIEGNVGGYGVYANKKVSYIGSAYSTVIYKDNTGVSFGDGDLAFYAKSKKINFGDGVNYKVINRVEFNGNVTIGLPFRVTLILDGREILTKEIDTTSLTVIAPTMGSTTFGSGLFGSNNDVGQSNVTSFEIKIPLYNNCREIEYRFEGEGQGIFELTGATLRYHNVVAYDNH